jgi:hypothetical protein
MRKLVFTVGLLGVLLAAFSALPAAAVNNTVSVSMTFTEPLVAGWPGPAPCPDIGFGTNCGSGEVRPFGHATETIAFGVGCGGACDVRTINLPQGSIFTEESASGFSCPGACGSQSYPHINPPLSATLTDVIVGGTGIFVGATGTLVGTVVAAGWHGQIQLSGTITLGT